MPSSEHGISCEVLVASEDGSFVPAEEFSVVTSPCGRFVSAFIESRTDEMFAIRVTRDLVADTGSASDEDYLAEVVVDGMWVPGSPYLLGVRTGGPASTRMVHMEGSYEDDGRTVKPFVFTEPLFTPLEDIVVGSSSPGKRKRHLPSERELNSLGSVRVELFKVAVTPARATDRLRADGQKDDVALSRSRLSRRREVLEFKEHVSHLTHTVRTDRDTDSSEPFEYFDHTLLEQAPFCSFLFHFRSRNVLEAIGIIAQEEGAAPSVIGTEATEPEETARLRLKVQQLEREKAYWRSVAHKAAEARKRARKEPSPVVDLTQDDPL